MRIKLIYILVASCFVMSHSLKAQEIETTDMQSRDSVIHKIDSLQQVVNTLDATLKETTDDLRDQRIWKNRSKYLNIAYANQSLTWEDINGTWKSKLAVGLTVGKTYYLHKKPIFGMVKFGIDWSYVDLNFGMYENNYSFPDLSYGNGHYYYPEGGGNDSSDEYEDESDDWYQVELGMQVGPSVTVNPVDHLKVNAYFRYAPCASILYMNEDVSANYASFFVCGGAVSYKAISVGIEGRWGSAKYNSLIDIDDEEGGGKEKIKWKTGATRFYISFRY